MVNEQLVAEDAPQPSCQLGGQCYLGNEVEHLLLQPQGIGNEVHIDGRLAAAGHTMQQGDGVLAH